jgi:hypothetical protein
MSLLPLIQRALLNRRGKLLENYAFFPSAAAFGSNCRKQMDEKAGLRRDAVRSRVIDMLKAQEIKAIGNEEG